MGIWSARAVAWATMKSESALDRASFPFNSAVVVISTWKKVIFYIPKKGSEKDPPTCWISAVPRWPWMDPSLSRPPMDFDPRFLLISLDTRYPCNGLKSWDKVWEQSDLSWSKVLSYYTWWLFMIMIFVWPNLASQKRKINHPPSKQKAVTAGLTFSEAPAVGNNPGVGGDPIK